MSERTRELLFPVLPHDIGPRAAAAMGDATLQHFVGTTTRSKSAARQHALQTAFGERSGALKRLAGAVKQHTLDHLDVYLERFMERAREHGTTIHVAADAAEARAICLAIAQEIGARRCIKSKSMVTEEIGLLDTLLDAGIETVETDLGEFILQLDDDAPSHIVTPMIHKDRAAVAAAFQRELGADYTEDPETLTAIARAHLRQHYEQADIGITGGNFLVAETGSLVLCTNEGNARFCSSVPDVHVAVVGIEKLVPTFADLTLMLKLLARSSTGQPLTVYTSILTGPRNSDEPDGARQRHIVLLDNGRSAILADRRYRQALRCIRCGACLNVCPVYRKIGGHSYGSVYPGPIGAVVTPLMRGAANYQDHPRATSLCGGCHRACPVDIQLPDMFVALRGDLVSRQRFRERLGRRLWALTLRWRLTYRLASWLMRWRLRRRADDGYVERAPGPGAAWTETRALPAPAGRPFRTFWRRYLKRRRRGDDES